MGSRGGQAGSIAQALSFLRILEADLKTISSETRRKLPAAREAAERGLLRIREVDVSVEDERQSAAGAASEGGDGAEDVAEDNREDSLSEALSNAEEVAMAFCAACDKSIPKVSLLAVGSLHKLLVHSAISSSLLDDVLQALEGLVDPATDPNLLLKVLEALLSLLASRRYQCDLNEARQSRGLTMLLQIGSLNDSSEGSPIGSPLEMVRKQTAEVAFRQVTSEIFYNSSESHPEQADEALPDPMARSASLPVGDIPESVQLSYLLFRDLCLLVSGSPCTWLNVETVRLELVLEVVEEALRGELFKQSKLMRSLLTSRLCPAVHERLCSTVDSKSYTLLLRIVFLLVVNFLDDLQADMEVMLVLLVRTVEKPSSMGECSTPQHQLLALEALRAVFSHQNGHVIHSLNRTFDEASHATNVVDSTIEIARMLSENIEDDFSASTLSILEGNMAPFSTPLLKMSGAKKQIQVIALALCLAALRAMLRSAKEDPSVAILLAGSWKRLVAPLVPIFETVRGDPANCASVIAVISEQLTTLVGLGDIVGLSEVQETVMECMSKAASKQLSSDNMRPIVVVQLFKSMFAAAFACQPPILDGWQRIVEVADELDLRLHSSNTTSLLPLEEELDAFYAAALEKLPVGAAKSFITALVAVSRQRINSESSGTKNEIALNQQRLMRIHKLLTGWMDQKKGEGLDSSIWELVAGHLVALGREHSDESLRSSALRFIHLLEMSALQSVPEQILPHDKVLAPLVDLMIHTPAETKLNVLEKLRILLETSGQLIHGAGAWRSVVSVLRSAVDMEEQKSSGMEVDEIEKLIQLGFKNLQLVAADFLAVMSFSVVGEFVDVVGSFGAQRQDVNTALTAVSLLWEVADFLAKSEHGNETDTIWLTLLNRLKNLSLDSRPEVRNGAIQSLFGALMAHGSSLSSNVWRTGWSECLTPLLNEVVVGGSSSEMEVDVVETASTAREKSLGGVSEGPNRKRIIMHHSRDTPQKQWDETRAVMLTNLSRLFRKFTQPLIERIGLAELQSAWESTLRAALLCSSGPSAAKEIATAGVGTMLELLNVAAKLESTVPEEAKDVLWTLSWEFMDNAVWAPVEEERKFVSHTTALTQLCDGLDSTCSQLPGGLQSRDSLTLINILVRAILFDVDPERSYPDVEKVALKALTNLRFREDQVDTWIALLKQMLRLLLSQKANPSVDRFVKTAIFKALQDLYQSEKLPKSVKVMELEDIVRTLFPIMSSRTQYVESAILEGKNRATMLSNRLGASEARIVASSNKKAESKWTADESDPLWVAAVDTFRVAIEHGCISQEEYRESLWLVLVDCFQKFLFPKSSMAVEGLVTPNARMLMANNDFGDIHKNLTAKVNRLVQQYDVNVVDTLQITLRRSHSASESIRQHMLRILTKGAAEGQTRSRFARACQAALFNLVRGDDTASDFSAVGLKAETSLTSVCHYVLGSYVRDGRRSGKCPLPAVRRAEVLYLLRELRALNAARMEKSSKTQSETDSETKISNLYPTVCDCIESADQDVRLLTRSLLVEAGGAFAVSSTPRHLLQ